MKKIFKIIIFSLIATLLAALFFLIVNKNKIINNSIDQKNPPRELMSAVEKRQLHLYHGANFEVVSRNQNGDIVEYRLVGLIEPKEIPFDLMKDEEKKNMGLEVEQKIQVLERDDRGGVLVYRLINSDRDIVKKY